jgi:C_GCAxxG_C_C family probable redox protein
MKEENVQDIVTERVKEILDLSGNCAQTTFAALQEQYGLDGEEILKALTVFPGLALRGEVCGAVVGALMALGLVYGRKDISDKRAYTASLPSARRFCSQFEEEFGSTSCSEILHRSMGKKYNLADPVEAREYLAAGGQKKCGVVVVNAVTIAGKLLERKKLPNKAL